MRSKRGAFWALSLLGSYIIWRNRVMIQRELAALGIKTPILGLDEANLVEPARSVAAKASGTMKRGATIAEHAVNQDVSNL